MMTKENVLIKYRGLGAIELMLSLGVISIMLYVTMNSSQSLLKLSPAQKVANSAYDYTKPIQRYITTHQTLLLQLLSNNGSTNARFLTLTPTVLKTEGFIKNDLYDKNTIDQFPCTIIYYDNKQLQAFTYYRSNANNKKTLDQRQLNDGLNHVGGMLGLYQNGVVSGAGLGWKLDLSFTKQMFKPSGTVDISQGVNTAAYTCQGTQIADNSYVANIGMELNITPELPQNDTISQYNDYLHDTDDTNSNNKMNNDLNMNFNSAGVNTQSNLVFQMNENCIMDPSNPATMQDYAPAVTETDKPNNLGCRNRQLGVSANTQNGRIITITGFQRGGDPTLLENKDNLENDIRPFVGEVKAAAIQPTTQVAVGTACTIAELGKMAQQQKSANLSDVNNLYLSQVQCMKSPLCPATTSGLCYMPLNSVTIILNTIQSSNHSISKYCPAGTFISAVDADSSVPTPSACCGNNDPIFGLASYCCHIDSCNKGGGSCATLGYTQPLSGYSTDNIPLFLGVKTTPSHWYQGCPTIHLGCNEGWGQVPDSYLVVRSITCTNDASQAAIIVNQ